MVATKVDPAPEIEPVAQAALAAGAVVEAPDEELLSLPQAPATRATTTAATPAEMRFLFTLRTLRRPGGAAASPRATQDEQEANRWFPARRGRALLLAARHAQDVVEPEDLV